MTTASSDEIRGPLQAPSKGTIAPGIVAALAMTHTPGLGDRMHLPPAEQMVRLSAGFGEGRRILAEARPDLLVVFVNDHFDMFSMMNMPTFAIAVAETHAGPPADAERWLQMTRRSFASDMKYARALLTHTVAQGFDVTRVGSADFVHNVLMPLKFLRPECDLPIVPVFVNCFAPPLPTFRRCYDFGYSVGQGIKRQPARVALIASGGISHWPPFASEDDPAPDELATRMLRIQNLGAAGRRADPDVRNLIHDKEAEMAASDRELINVPWDHRLLEYFAQGDIEALTQMSYEEIEREGGNGGHEMSLWVALMGALGGAKSRTVFYEPVKEWMGGVGLISYDAAIQGA